jgi:coenzyme F420-reducing hydrogenase beta subunit
VLYSDPSMKRGCSGCRLTCRIHNTMDESEEVRIEEHCSQCDNYGHTYKKCPMNEQPVDAEAGPFGNPSDRRPTQARLATRIRAR